MFFAFGLAFEVPVITVLLILTGMVKARAMSHARPYVIVGAFVLGMLLTPPDIISQTLLAVPVWLLYELGIIVAVFVLKSKGIDPNGDSHDPEPEPSSSSYMNTTDNDGFDNRYAEQNKDVNPHQAKAAQQQTENVKKQQTPIDEDFDFDAEFDKIDAEMEKLHKEAEQREHHKNENKPTGSLADTSSASDSDTHHKPQS
jgi:sec-independent protein translocase protein TatC